MKSWIKAMRLRTLPLALASIFTGSALAYIYALDHSINTHLAGPFLPLQSSLHCFFKYFPILQMTLEILKKVQTMKIALVLSVHFKAD